MGKFAFNRGPFDLHCRTELVLDQKVAGADLAQLPIVRNFEANAVPGDFFPLIQQSSSNLTDIIQLIQGTSKFKRFPELTFAEYVLKLKNIIR